MKKAVFPPSSSPTARKVETTVNHWSILNSYTNNQLQKHQNRKRNIYLQEAINSPVKVKNGYNSQWWTARTDLAQYVHTLSTYLLLAQDPVAFFFRSDCRKPDGSDRSLWSAAAGCSFVLKKRFFNFACADARALPLLSCGRCSNRFDLGFDDVDSCSVASCLRTRRRLWLLLVWSCVDSSVEVSNELALPLAFAARFFTWGNQVVDPDVDVPVPVSGKLADEVGLWRPVRDGRLPRVVSVGTLAEGVRSLSACSLRVLPLEILPLQKSHKWYIFHYIQPNISWPIKIWIWDKPIIHRACIEGWHVVTKIIWESLAAFKI